MSTTFEGISSMQKVLKSLRRSHVNIRNENVRFIKGSNFNISLIYYLVDASYIVQAVAQAVAAVFSKGKERARSSLSLSSSSLGATSSEDESEVDPLVGKKVDQVVEVVIGQLVGAQASQSQNVRQKLILAIAKKLPEYWHHSGVIEKILKQHHKMQRRTATINADPKLKAYNRTKMGKNRSVKEW
ncbi:8330_t:CDS:2 [Racocetra fulgida]|uniref:8330_t:CDS:1 n=1 Tax=Racocetra fulgida TaxID=60492 RepID=A0A9N9F0G7_9GLOM|nr:8330_t:CDS:2 [Racocetra fulgida]